MDYLQEAERHYAKASERVLNTQAELELRYAEIAVFMAAIEELRYIGNGLATIYAGMEKARKDGEPKPAI